jgi:hypothetical protein
MGFRRPAVIIAIAGTLVLGTAVAAFADTSTGAGLSPGGNDCAGPVFVQPGKSAEETGSAFETGTGTPVSVKWSIWTNSTDHLNTATRAIAYQGTSVPLQAVLNFGPDPGYYWGCLFNNSSVDVSYTVTINSN